MYKLRHKADQADRWSPPFTKQLKAFAALMLMSLMVTSAAAAPEDEVRATFDRFVAAQNAHDIKAVGSLLLASPDFLWVTRGTAIWGQDAAIKRFASLYEGTWTLEPDTSKLKIVILGSGVAHIHVPIVFSIGAPGQSAQQTRFLMNKVVINTPNGWRIAAILPIPAPAQ
jgi:ketosteroid isomerase-like protein